MEQDHPSVRQTEDNSIHGNTAPVVHNHIEMPKESPWKQPAVYIAALALILVIGGEWRRWVALDEKIAAVKAAHHDYFEEINVWETDTFNREKDVDATLKARFGLEPSQLFGKLKPPPVPKER